MRNLPTFEEYLNEEKLDENWMLHYLTPKQRKIMDDVLKELNKISDANWERDNESDRWDKKYYSSDSIELTPEKKVSWDEIDDIIKKLQKKTKEKVFAVKKGSPARSFDHPHKSIFIVKER